MALGFIARALQAGRAKFGAPSLLDGQPAGNAVIQRGVETFVGDPGRSDDNYTAHVDLAIIDAAFSPRVGQTLVHPTEGTFRLERLAEDNGYSRHFVVLQQ